MSVKKQLISEIELRKSLSRKDYNLKVLSMKIGMSYSGLRRWVKDDDHNLGVGNLEALADVLGKRFILIDKEH